MINNNISSSILTIGCEFIPPQGGIAQVIYNYKKYIFGNFKFISNSKEGNKIYKIYIFIKSLIQLVYYLLLDREIKIVHIHSASYNSFYRSAYYIKVAILFKKKVILHIHGGGFKEFYQTNPNKISAILNSCNQIITLSKSWELFFKSIAQNTKINIVENLVPKPTLTTNKKTNKIHLLFLGLICKEKGIYDLIEMLHENSKDLEDKMVLHIGGNGETNYLQKLLTEYKLNNWVIYEGWVSGEYKEKLLQTTDAFILPSYIEGMPMAIIEAMTYGKPIISTNVGGIPELIENGVNGFLFNPGDKISMKNAICELARDINERERMGNESLKKSVPFLPKQIENKLYKIYSSLLSK